MKKSTKILATLLFSATMAQAQQLPDSQVLVNVNGVKIYKSEVDSALMNATNGRPDLVPAKDIRDFQKKYINKLIGEELVYGDAKKIGILKTKEFKNELEKAYEAMKVRIEKSLAIRFWQKEQEKSIKVSENELKKYYKENKNEFNQPELVHARHILVKTEAEANDIINELKSLSGEALKSKFIELAKSKSVGPSGAKGGDLGFFAPGNMVPAFNSKVFSMKVGTITKEPVHTEFGYHVIYLEDKKPKEIKSFDDVKTFIEKRLKLEKLKTKLETKMRNLRDSAVIK